MANIIDYARGATGPALRFKDMNAADALALTLLSWLDWDGIGGEGVELARAAQQIEGAGASMEADADPQADGGAGLGGARGAAANGGNSDAAGSDAEPMMRASGATSVQAPGAELELARVMAASPRYGGLKLYGFERADMAQPALQFAALTLWDGHDAYLAFRGTDSSLAGWFEDIQLAYSEATPSQLHAQAYLERAARRFGGGLYLGGHSKGGALALYAAVNAGAVQPRIRRVYSFDGPGLSRTAYQSASYAQLRARLLAIVPPESVVGMLLWQDGELRVVRSDARGVRQHDPMSWLTDARGLVYAAELSPESLRLRDVARALLSALPPQGIEQLANSLYALVLSTGARTLGELSQYFASHPDVLGQVQQDAGGRAMYTLLYLMATAAGGDAQSSEQQQRQALEGLPGLGL